MTSQTQTAHTNRLATQKSSYLKSAAHQPVNWFPWSDTVFDVARKENKPILLDIGAVWCHWCHVMDMESYENESTAEIINQHFIAVKVDRDERPDIDARYQAAVSAISGQGGWPLTAFLTPDGKVFYGGTYFPPEDRYGRTGFPTVLQILAETFTSNPQKILENASQVDKAVRSYLARHGDSTDLSNDLVDSAVSSMVREYDTRFGGFGSAPKFFHSGAVELLLAKHDHSPDTVALDIVTHTLRKIAQGGIHDQIGGGFHRYSTDEKWIIPHFEKMLYDNAAILSNYVHAFQMTGDAYFKTIALDIIRFVNNTLSDQQRGGFYASQDADVDFGDDGSYFTWRKDAASDVLTPDEFQVVQQHYNIYDIGEMHHDSSQNVLFVDKDPDLIAESLQKPREEVEKLLDSGRQKMARVRSEKKAPFVDTSIFSNWNGMMIVSYLEAYKAFGDEEIRAFALKSLRRILGENVTQTNFVTHRQHSVAPEGFLEDQVEIVNALLSSFEITGEAQYLRAARDIMDRCLELFWDEKDGAFFDVPRGHSRIGALSIPNKPIQDSPTPGANAVAIRVLGKLSAITEEPSYRDSCERALRYFASSVGNYGIFGATYFLALHEFLNPPPHVIVVAQEADPQGVELLKVAMQTFRHGMTITRVSPTNIANLPSSARALGQTFTRPTALVCTNLSCAPPVYETKSLISTIRSFGKSTDIIR